MAKPRPTAHTQKSPQVSASAAKAREHRIELVATLASRMMATTFDEKRAALRALSLLEAVTEAVNQREQHLQELATNGQRQRSDPEAFLQPEFPSQIEIARIAGMLMGHPPKGTQSEAYIQTIEACESAAILLRCSGAVATALRDGKFNAAGHFDYVFQEHFTARQIGSSFATGGEDDWDDQPDDWEDLGSRLTPEQLSLFEKVGWTLDWSENQKDEKTCPWKDFWDLLPPKKPSQDREPRFKLWLEEKANQRYPETSIKSLKNKGITKAFFLHYLTSFSGWWANFRGQINSSNAKMRRKKAPRAKKSDPSKKRMNRRNTESDR